MTEGPTIGATRSVAAFDLIDQAGLVLASGRRRGLGRVAGSAVRNYRSLRPTRGVDAHASASC
jgi:hypothetical protein